MSVHGKEEVAQVNVMFRLAVDADHRAKRLCLAFECAADLVAGATMNIELASCVVVFGGDRNDGLDCAPFRRLQVLDKLLSEIRRFAVCTDASTRKPETDGLDISDESGNIARGVQVVGAVELEVTCDLVLGFKGLSG